MTRGARETARHRFLASASAVLASSLGYQDRLAALARVAVPELGDFAVVDVVEENGTLRRIAAAHADPARQPLADQLLRHPPAEARAEGSSNALRTGRPVHVERFDDELLLASTQTEEHAGILRRLELRSSLSVPLRARGETLGAISFAMAESGRAFTPADVALATDLASLAAVSIANARLYARARQAIRARDEVLGMVSHELRNPLNATLLTLESLLDWGEDALPERPLAQLSAIRGHTDQMVRLVDDLLDVVRSDAGLLRVHLAPVGAEALVRRAAAGAVAAAERLGIRFTLDLPTSLPLLLADPGRVEQILANLLDNAFRLTPAGGEVRLSVERAESAVRITVTDSGSGFPPGVADTLFDAPFRGESNSGGALGLGLVIAGRLVRANGGEISASAAPGGGARVAFTLPVLDSAAAGQGAGGRLPGIPLFRPAADKEGEPARLSPPPPPGAGGGAVRAARFASTMATGRRGAGVEGPSPAEYLRHRILSAVHLGHLQPGDRLPSIREAARDLGVTHHRVVHAYERLEGEGVIEKRPRSGVFVAPLPHRRPELLAESARWVAGVLAGACEHQIRVSRVPDLLRRWTTAAAVRCACIESDRDHLRALSDHLHRQFGIVCSPTELVPDLERTIEARDEELLPDSIRSADLLLTTTFHGPLVRRLAEWLDRPLVVMTIDPDLVATIEKRLLAGHLTLVCADPRFAERMIALRDGALADRFRVVLADDEGAVRSLDPGEPVLLTRAARDLHSSLDLRLVAPHYPSFSLDSSRELCALLVHLNLAAERHLAGAGRGP